MKRHATSYFLTEGVRSIFLHGFMSFAAVGVIVACLLIMGSFSLLAVNIDELIRGLETENEILVYVDETLSDSEARSVGSRISTIENVADRVFVSREEALEDYVSKLGEKDQALMEGYDENNNIRHRYRVFLSDINLVDETVKKIEAISGVAEVRVDMVVARGLISTRRIVETVSITLIIALLIVSLFIISNTIKLATFDRREEIGIMRIVGATKSFIRWPFVVEGFLLGVTASVVAFFLQWILYSWFTGSVLGNIAMIEIISFGDMFLPILLVFLLTGFTVGVGGSLLTIRKFLKV